MSRSRTTPGPQSPGRSPSAGRPCVMRAWSRGRASVPRIRLRSARIPVAAGVFCLSRTPAVLGGGGLERRRELGDLPGFDLLFPVDAPPPKTVSSRSFRTCAVPVVNLLERVAEPIRRIDHRALGSTCSCRICGTGTVAEVHSVIAVDALEGGERSPVMPYFSLSGGGDAPPSLMWFLRRNPSLDGIGTGTCFCISRKRRSARRRLGLRWLPRG